MRMILGSESKWRKQLFAEMGYEFEVMPARIDEKSIRDSRPEMLTQLLAIAKNRALHARLAGEEFLLVTGDQVVWANGRIREKPTSFAEANEILANAHKYPATTYSAIAVYNSVTQYLAADVDTATIQFDRLPDEVIEKLLEEGDVMHCSGGFTCESLAIRPYIAKLEGTMDSVQGFPKNLVAKLISAVS